MRTFDLQNKKNTVINKKQKKVQNKMYNSCVAFIKCCHKEYSFASFAAKVLYLKNLGVTYLMMSSVYCIITSVVLLLPNSSLSTDNNFNNQNQLQLRN